ncbi:MAG: anhydro-N-acetylmuramic acid kinase [Proteobacteria bacterium]|nr:anhydro-N-acetylmuramic acid kinase [Pseudomonadota bacterium]
MNLYIGLLSGTSVDGIDAVLVEFNQGSHKIVATHGQKFSPDLTTKLQDIIQTQEITLKTLSKVDSLLAFEFAQAVEVLLNKVKVNNKDITAIGSHGQTIFHQPNGNHTNTIQIGSPHKLAASTGINVVANFRQLDMAVGGQGAPLVPIIHQKLFAQEDKNTAVINLGGIANISFVGKDYPAAIGYDIGPANCLMDGWITIHKQQPFDKDGNWAKQGKLNDVLLAQMLKDDYFHKPYPKSTGREYFNSKWFENFIEQFKNTSAVDIQTTLTHLTAKSIAQAIAVTDNTIDEIMVMGGGTHNDLLVDLIQSYTKVTIQIAEDGDWIEALLFAYLAERRINNQKLNLSSITGNYKEILVGDIIEI